MLVGKLIEICRNYWVDLKSLENDIDPTCATSQAVFVAHQKIQKYWDMLDNGDRTPNEVVTLCSNVYDDNCIGDTPFIGTPDEGRDSDEDSERQSSSDEDSSDNNWNDITEGISIISSIFIYLFDSATLRILQIFKIAFTPSVSKNIVRYTCERLFYTEKK